jgi:methylglutamate dehydrogenase subunit B
LPSPPEAVQIVAPSEGRFMLQIPCPFCGPRDEAEFHYKGDASVSRPAGDAPQAAFLAFVYERENPKGWHDEYWQHVSGCRSVLRVRRNTLTHAIAAAELAGEAL